MVTFWLTAAFLLQTQANDDLLTSNCARRLEGEPLADCLAETAEALAAGGSDAVACSDLQGNCPEARRVLVQLSSKRLPPMHVSPPPSSVAGAAEVESTSAARASKNAGLGLTTGHTKAASLAISSDHTQATPQPNPVGPAGGRGSTAQASRSLTSSATASTQPLQKGAVPAVDSAGLAPLPPPPSEVLASAEAKSQPDAAAAPVKSARRFERGKAALHRGAALLQQALRSGTQSTSAAIFWIIFSLVIFLAVCLPFGMEWLHALVGHAVPWRSRPPPAFHNAPATGSASMASEASLRWQRRDETRRNSSSCGLTVSSPQIPAPSASSVMHTSATLPGVSEVGGLPDKPLLSKISGQQNQQLLGPLIPPSPLPSARAPPPLVGSKRYCPQLCPGLVVPRGSECVLAVQPLPFTSGREAAGSNVEVLDLRGKPVLRAKVARPLQWPQLDNDLASPTWSAVTVPAVTLRMLQPVSTPGLTPAASGRLWDSSVLSVCREGITSDGRRTIFIHDANGRLFGTLAKDPARSRYSLTSTRGDGSIFFDGIFQNHAILIVNDQQEPLADAEPCNMAFNPQGKYYRLRVSSGVDVGLMLVGLVCIDEMEDAQSD